MERANFDNANPQTEYAEQCFKILSGNFRVGNLLEGQHVCMKIRDSVHVVHGVTDRIYCHCERL